MDKGHREIQEIVVQMLDWYGFVGDLEVGIGDGLLDCAAFKKGESNPFMGIEVHMKGNLDTDLKKLLGNEFLTHKVILTPDRSLISSMSQSTLGIKWFLLPDKYETGFENYLREVSSADHSKNYWFHVRATVQNLMDSPEPVKNFETLLKNNGLNVETAEEIIFRGAASGGDVYRVVGKLRDTNEYAFLSSIGILVGLEIYWYDMEWDGDIRCSYEKVEMPDGTSTRILKGEPLAYTQNKDVIAGVMRKYVQDHLGRLKNSLKDYSNVLNEITLIGSKGRFSKPYSSLGLSSFTSEYELSISSGAVSTDIVRLGALASNPKMKEFMWKYGQKLVELGLGIQISLDLIMAPYKLLSDVGGYRGTISGHVEEVDEYISWWALLNAGLRNKSVKGISESLGVPWERIEECIELTFSKGLSSRYIPDSSGLIGMKNFTSSTGSLGRVNDFSIFKPQEFSDFCYKKMIDAFSKMVDFGNV
jgi:hypothetical protein